MALPTYSTGAASVAAGGTVVTGTGTLWSGVNVKQGDFISIGGSIAVLITEVTDATHLKVTPWTSGAMTDQPYVIYQNYVGRVVGVAAAEDVGDMLARLNDQAPIYNVPTGDTAPDPSYGIDGQWAYQVETGTWWVKSGGVWVEDAGPSSGSSVTVSDTPPASPGVGDGWFETDTDILWIWDGTAWMPSIPASAIPSPATVAPLSSITPPVVGTAIKYAREDHRHPLETSPATVAPLMDITPAVVGIATKYAREDHRHPVDTSRASAQPTTLGAAPNFNSVTTSGDYFTPDSAATNTPTSPTAHFWWLQVFNIGNYTLQVATLYETQPPTRYVRTQVSLAWGPWRELVYSDNPAFTGNVDLAAIVPSGLHYTFNVGVSTVVSGKKAGIQFFGSNVGNGAGTSLAGNNGGSTNWGIGNLSAMGIVTAYHNALGFFHAANAFRFCNAAGAGPGAGTMNLDASGNLSIGPSIDNAAWTAYTPTAVYAFPGAGSALTATGRYKQIGKTVHLATDVTVTTVGSGSVGNILVSLPPGLNAAARRYAGISYDYGATFKSGAAVVNGATDATKFGTADGAGGWFNAPSTALATSITYELAWTMKTLTLTLALLLGGCTVTIDREPPPPEVYTKAETDAINAEQQCRNTARTPLQAMRCGVRRP